RLLSRRRLDGARRGYLVRGSVLESVSVGRPVARVHPCVCVFRCCEDHRGSEVVMGAFASLADILKWFGGLFGKMISTRLGGWIASALLVLGLSWTSYKFAVAPFKDLISGAMG